MESIQALITRRDHTLASNNVILLYYSGTGETSCPREDAETASGDGGVGLGWIAWVGSLCVFTDLGPTVEPHCRASMPSLVRHQLVRPRSVDRQQLIGIIAIGTAHWQTVMPSTASRCPVTYTNTTHSCLTNNSRRDKTNKRAASKAIHSSLIRVNSAAATWINCQSRIIRSLTHMLHALLNTYQSSLNKKHIIKLI